MTPDGKYVLFGKDPDGTYYELHYLDAARNHALFVVPINGGTPQLVNAALHASDSLAEFVVTPDGRNIVYRTNESGDLYLTDIPIPSSIIPVPGDFDSNGSVDASDYVIWRTTLGETGVVLLADGDGNGEVGIGDYDVWRANFGQSTFGSVVPEPLTLAYLMIICAYLTSRRCHLSRDRHLPVNAWQWTSSNNLPARASR
jgi:hypothetical protein